MLKDIEEQEEQEDFEDLEEQQDNKLSLGTALIDSPVRIRNIDAA